jgi:hypothetical protein
MLYCASVLLGFYSTHTATTSTLRNSARSVFAMSAIPIPTTNKIQTYEWRALYLTALFETDKNRLPGRILRAERALIIREHELFACGGGTEEKTIVNNALHALSALRRCLGLA